VNDGQFRRLHEQWEREQESRYMDMAEAATCPECGAELEYRGDDCRGHCPAGCERRGQ